MTSMTPTRFLILALAATFALLTPRPAEARNEASFDFFYDSLAPQGDWIDVAGYGLCWQPTGVDRDWEPYSDGYWTFTDAGWTWVSYEDFGGIVYHYGRWLRVEDEGWCWVPDYDWGPAWVSWRESDDYVGWAPLPPEARWRRETGISIWADRSYDIGPGFYHFCHVRDFGAPVLRTVFLDRRENITIIRSTVNITNITYNTTYVGGPVIYNGGPNFARINQRSANKIPTLKLVKNTEVAFDKGPNGKRSFNSQMVGNQLVVAAPALVRPADTTAFQDKAKRTVKADKISHGWNSVKDPDERQQLKKEIQQQTKDLTPETAPARPVAATELKVLPEKADPKAKQATSLDSRKAEKQPKEITTGTADKTTPPSATDAPPAEKTAKEMPHEKTAKGKKPVTEGQTLQPFRPVTETERKTPTDNPPVGNVPEAKPAKQQKMQADQPEAIQQKQLEAQRKAEAMRQRQQTDNGNAERQKMQIEQERRARQQEETAQPQQQKQKQMKNPQQPPPQQQQPRFDKEVDRQREQPRQKAEVQRSVPSPVPGKEKKSDKDKDKDKGN